MRLHYYTTNPSYLCVHQHQGQGIGSIFAIIFSKVAAKTAAKTALTAAKVAGKKVVKVAAKQGSKIAKKALNEGLKQAKELGTDLAIQGINKLENAAINKGLPPELVQNVSNVAKVGAHKAIDKVGTLAGNKVNNITSHIDSRIEDSDSEIDEPQIILPVKKSSQRINSIKNVRGSKVQRRKRKLTGYPYHSKKVKFSSLQNAIEES